MAMPPLGSLPSERGRRRLFTEAGVALVAALLVIVSLSGAVAASTGFTRLGSSGSGFPDPMAYVVNGCENTVTPIDTGTNTAGTPIPAGYDPWSIAITPDGKTLYVVNVGGDTVTPIDTATDTAGTPIPVGTAGADPMDVAISPDGAVVYVTEGDSVTPIDTATNTPGTPFFVGMDPGAIAISPDGKTGYVVDSDGVQPFATDTHLRGAAITIASSGSYIAITPDGKTLYVPGSNTYWMNVIDTATDTALTPFYIGLGGYGVAITPDGTEGYVALHGGTLVPFSTATNTAGVPIFLGPAPNGVAITPDGKTAYVTNENPNMVIPVDLATSTAEAPIAAGQCTYGVATITPDQAPVASLGAIINHHHKATKFNASASRGTTSAIAQYAWRFGDGTTATTTSPRASHTYAEAGRYTVVLTVTDTAGTSTTRVFTGQSMSRNGGAVAQKAILVKIP
jgi:YVTN family beta-propeller protein